MRQLADLDDLELQRGRRHRDHRLGHLPVEGFLAQAADDDGDVAGGAHVVPFVGTGHALAGGRAGSTGDRRSSLLDPLRASAEHLTGGAVS